MDASARTAKRASLKSTRTILLSREMLHYRKELVTKNHLWVRLSHIIWFGFCRQFCYNYGVETPLAGPPTIDDLHAVTEVVYESLVPLLFIRIRGLGRYLVGPDRRSHLITDRESESLGGPIRTIDRNEFERRHALRSSGDREGNVALLAALREIRSALPLPQPTDLANVQESVLDAAHAILRRERYEREVFNRARYT
ncbi:MAG: hypothetical protein GC162_03210 [Planctomycetes bacterium]|nr:hypothetical protein [Planctomycetota bacterium]